MFRSSALLGLAALAQAEQIPVVKPAVGYGSPTATGFDGDTITFQYDLSAWDTDVDKPSGFIDPNSGLPDSRQVLAFKISKGVAGAATDVRVNWQGGGSTPETIDFVKKDDTGLAQDKWYCVDANPLGVRLWGTSALTVDITVSCDFTSNACTNQRADFTGLAGADFEVTAYFYRSARVIEGWGQEACAGGVNFGCWDSTKGGILNECQDRDETALVSPLMSVDPVYRDGLSEAFTASWTTLNGGVDETLSLGNPESTGWQTAPVGAAADGWLVGIQMYLDASTITTEGLYSKISGQKSGNLATFMWCFTSIENRASRPNGNYRYSSSDVNAACNMGCYPEGSCTVGGKPTLSVDPQMMDHKLDWSQTNEYAVIATVLVSDNTASGPGLSGNTAWISPDHKVCYAFGHQCSGASMTGPSAILAMAALYLASRF